MEQGIQDKQKGNLKLYGCAYLCLLQFLKPELEDIPYIKIPDSLLGEDYYIMDWVKLYNYLVIELKSDKPLVDGVAFQCFKEGEVQICKNLKNDFKTSHFTLRKNDVDIWDPLPPDRKAVREKHYVYHWPYDFYINEDKKIKVRL